MPFSRTGRALSQLADVLRENKRKQEAEEDERQKWVREKNQALIAQVDPKYLKRVGPDGLTAAQADALTQRDKRETANKKQQRQADLLRQTSQPLGISVDPGATEIEQGLRKREYALEGLRVDQRVNLRKSQQQAGNIGLPQGSPAYQQMVADPQTPLWKLKATPGGESLRTAEKEIDLSKHQRDIYLRDANKRIKSAESQRQFKEQALQEIGVTAAKAGFNPYVRQQVVSRTRDLEKIALDDEKANAWRIYPPAGVDVAGLEELERLRKQRQELEKKLYGPSMR